MNPDFDRASDRLKELRVARLTEQSSKAPQTMDRPPQPPRPLSSLMIPESSQERDAYRKWSREKAHIDKMNDQWYGLPWAARALQVVIGLAILMGFVYTIVSSIGR